MYGGGVNGNALSDERMQFQVALREQNIASFQQLVLDLSTPGHATYGKHLEGHEVYDILKPAQHGVDTVRRWLESNNITNIRHNGHFITFQTDVETASNMLETRFNWYRNDVEGDEKLRALRYSLPEDISEHVDFLHPTIKFPSTKPLHSMVNYAKRASTISKIEPLSVTDITNVDVTASTSSCDLGITPTCLLELYNIYYTADANNGNKAAFASFLKVSIA